jgi:hypothetical protein
MNPTLLPTLRANRVPANLFDGAFVRDWFGVAERLTMDDREWRLTAWTPANADDDLARFRLPTDRPESRWQVARVMERGVRCPVGCPDRHEVHAAIPATVHRAGDAFARALGMTPCGCQGSGWLLRPTPTYHLLTRAESPTGHNLGDAVAAELVGCQVGRVVAGLGPIAGVLGKWLVHHHERDRSWTRHLVIDLHHQGGGLWARDTLQGDHGWQCSLVPGVDTIWLQGPETGPEGMAAVDRAALDHGFALQNPDGTIVAPWPEVSDAL